MIAPLITLQVAGERNLKGLYLIDVNLGDPDRFFRFISELHCNFAIRKSERWQTEK